MECNVRKEGEASGKSNKKDVWKICWQLQVPNMVKMFLWRALNNLLLARSNLRRRGVVQDIRCPLCGLEEENVAHVLWNCPAASDVWGCGSVKFQKRCCGETNFFSIFEDIIKRYDRSDVELFAARHLWLCRNGVLHAGHQLP